MAAQEHEGLDAGTERWRQDEEREHEAVLPAAVGGWLAARLNAAGGDLTVSLQYQGGRLLLRSEAGQSASLLEQPLRTEFSGQELLQAVLRWARGHKLGARAESSSGGEQRVRLTALRS